ncbi:hypothetical protein [Marinobacter antarcticus]|uniref:hypothetical protein n=1 Tax=Marinobacter antarcticus TaxID=564117 RepID=UPI001114B714|nr:hypothetical protein [Marinobacter antarcticus]
MSVLTACGDGTVSSSVDNEQPATYTYSELVNLTSYDVGLYRFGSDGSAKLVRSIDHTGAVDAMFFGEINGITFFSTRTDTNETEKPGQIYLRHLKSRNRAPIEGQK